jgi:hypothetical protein
VIAPLPHAPTRAPLLARAARSQVLLQTLGSAGELVNAKACTCFLIDTATNELVSAHEFVAAGQIRERDVEIRVRAHSLTSSLTSRASLPNAMATR